jgi:hypothetical protein
MRAELLREGRKLVIEPEDRHLLQGVVAILQTEGHAVSYAEQEFRGKVTSAEAIHYLTCSQCTKEKERLKEYIARGGR